MHGKVEGSSQWPWNGLDVGLGSHTAWNGCGWVTLCFSWKRTENVQESTSHSSGWKREHWAMELLCLAHAANDQVPLLYLYLPTMQALPGHFSDFKNQPGLKPAPNTITDNPRIGSYWETSHLMQLHVVWKTNSHSNVLYSGRLQSMIMSPRTRAHSDHMALPLSWWERVQFQRVIFVWEGALLCLYRASLSLAIPWKDSALRRPPSNQAQ